MFPARTTVGTSGLLVRDALIEIDLIGACSGSATTVPPSSAPKPLANYSEARRVGDLVFAAGQLPSDFVTGVPEQIRRNPAFPFYGSDIKLQTQYILDNARTIFAAGCGLEDVIKAQVFLADLNDFNGLDEVWKTYFPHAAGPDHRRHHGAAGPRCARGDRPHRRHRHPQTIRQRHAQLGGVAPHAGKLSCTHRSVFSN